MVIEKEKIPKKGEETFEREFFSGEKKEKLFEKDIYSKEREEELREELSKLKKDISSTPLSTRDEKKEIERMSYPEKIGALVSLTFEKGIIEATSIAMSLDNPAIVDELHDTLIDQYREDLLEKGIVKKSSARGDLLESTALRILIVLILLLIIGMIYFLIIRYF